MCRDQAEQILGDRNSRPAPGARDMGVNEDRVRRMAESLAQPEIVADRVDGFGIFQSERLDDPQARHRRKILRRLVSV